jgi:hypothetical protein
MLSVRALSEVLRARCAVALVALVAVGGCYDFHYEEPATDGGSLDGGDATPEPRCVPGGYYCGGEKLEGAPDTLYRCNDDAPPTLMAKCANGCAVSPPGKDDACLPPSPCVVGGTYCGGDKINGDPDVLYRCGSNDAITIVERCANGCQVNPPGQDDDCR